LKFLFGFYFKSQTNQTTLVEVVRLVFQIRVQVPSSPHNVQETSHQQPNKGGAGALDRRKRPAGRRGGVKGCAGNGMEQKT